MMIPLRTISVNNAIPLDVLMTAAKNLSPEKVAYVGDLLAVDESALVEFLEIARQVYMQSSYYYSYNSMVPPLTVKDASKKAVSLVIGILAIYQVINGIVAGVLSVVIQENSNLPEFLTSQFYYIMIGALAGLPIFVILDKKWFTSATFKKRSKMPAPVFFVSLMIMFGINFLVSAFFTAIDSLLIVGVSTTSAYETLFQGMDSPVAILYIVLIGPIMEEMIFRGAILNKLREFGDNFAIVISATCFSLMHMNFYQMAATLPMGIIFGFIACRYSIKFSILLHIINNFVSMLSSDFRVPLVIIELGCLIAGIVILCVKGQVLRRFLLEGRSQVGARIRYGLSSVGMILAFIFVGLICILLLFYPLSI